MILIWLFRQRFVLSGLETKYHDDSVIDMCDDYKKKKRCNQEDLKS